MLRFGSIGSFLLCVIPLVADDIPTLEWRDEFAYVQEPIDPSYVWDRYDATDGLPSTHVNDLAQTADGYLWLSTRAGVARYDGTRFETVGNRWQGSLGSDDCTGSLTTQSGSTLWVSRFSGLMRFSGSLEESWVLDPSEGFGRIWNLWENPDGGLWLKEGEDWSAFEAGEFHRRDWEFGQVDRLQTLLRTDSGDVFVGGKDGLQLSNGTSEGEFLRVRDTEGDALDYVWRILELKDGRIWAASNDGLGEIRDGISYPVLKFRRGDHALNGGILFQSTQGEVWLGVSNLGLFVLDPTRPFEASEIKYFRGSQFNAGIEDKEGSVWIAAGERGVIKLRKRPVQGVSLRANRVLAECWSVLPGRENDYWLGTDRGVFRRTNDGTEYLSSAIREEGYFVKSLCFDSRGRLWIGGRDGIGRFDQGQYYFQLEDYCEPHADRPVNVIAPLSDGHIWCGWDGGVFHFDPDLARIGGGGEPGQPGYWLCVSDRHEVAFGVEADRVDVRYILEEKEGGLWLGTHGQGLLYRPELHAEWTLFGVDSGLSDLRITAIKRDSVGRLWVATEVGLNLFSDQRFISFTSNDGLYDDVINSVVVDESDDLWLGCNKGIVRVAAGELEAAMRRGNGTPVQFVVYDETDGMPSTETNGGFGQAGTQLDDGRILFPTIAGVALIDPDELLNLERPPELVIRRIEIDQMNATSWFTYSSAETPLIEVAPAKGDLIEIFFSANTFTSPDRIQYRYRLKGLEGGDWVTVDEGRSATYTDLKPGDYLFTVIAANSHGVWNLDGASVRLLVLPSFYETSLFKVGVILLLGLCGAGWHRRQLRSRLWKQQMKSEIRLERERCRIAGEMHDDVGNQLARIAFLSASGDSQSVHRKVRKISEIAKESIRSIGEIVWTIAPEHNTLGGLFSYSQDYATRLAEDTGLVIVCLVEGVGEDRPVTSEFRRSVFLVIKEALGNAVKHSCASEIRFELREIDGDVEASIQDNGCGFSSEVGSDSGHGLRSMSQRIETLGGTIQIGTGSFGGTIVGFRLGIHFAPGKGVLDPIS